MSEFNEHIAEVEVVFEDSQGVRKPGLLYIGRPHLHQPGEWRCPVGIFPLYERLPDVAGADSLHALSSALRLMKSRLKSFYRRGGKIHARNDRRGHDEEQPFSFGSYFDFGDGDN